MHIVSILTSLTSGGAEMLVVNLSREYVARGHRSTVLTLTNAASVGNSDAMEAELRQKLTDDGAEHIGLELGRSRGMVKGWSRMRRLLARLRPDIVHAHTLRAVPMLYSPRAQVPIVATHHNSHLGFAPQMFRLFDRIVDSYVAISRESEAIIGRHARRPIAHIPNAASRTFTAGAPRGPLAHPPKILSVGTISAQKHYDLVVAVAASMRGRTASADMPCFLVAGGGTDVDAMRSLARKSGVSDHLSFLGERSDVAELMQEADIYLNTSRYEGMPVTLLEALASGLPIVATRVPGNVELVEEGRNGLLCTLDRPEEIAGAIDRLASDGALYAHCSRGALDMSANFSIEATATRHLDLFTRLAA